MSRVTNPQRVTREAFFALFDPSIHGQLAACLDRSTTHGIACFENLAFDSSHVGARSAVIYGEGCTYATLDALLDSHLGVVPSRFQYPSLYFTKPLPAKGQGR